MVVCTDFMDSEETRMLAMGLGIASEETNKICESNHGWKDRLQKILWAWLNGKGHPPKWELLVQVMRAPVVNTHFGAAAKAAVKIEQKYCVQSAKLDTLTADLEGEC